MRLKTIAAVLCLLFVAGMAQAQNNVSGSGKCAKGDPSYKVDIGSNHSFLLEQNKCTWDKPMEINGVKSKEGVASVSYDMNRNKATYHGYYMDTMENGDKAEYHYHGTGILKDGQMQGFSEQWTLVRGSGKLKGVKGKGSCKGTGTADGGSTFDCDGEYTAAAGK